MTRVWSARSRENLVRVNPHLVAVMTYAVKTFEASSPFRVVIVSGFRSELEQMRLFKAGLTPLKTGSKHQTANAVDVALIGKKDGRYCALLEPYQRLNTNVQGWAAELDVDVEWGGSWKSVDGPHFQINP